MPNLIKKSWTVSNVALTAHKRPEAVMQIDNKG